LIPTATIGNKLKKAIGDETSPPANEVSGAKNANDISALFQFKSKRPP
jgi:hypothetical protein